MTRSIPREVAVEILVAPQEIAMVENYLRVVVPDDLVSAKTLAFLDVKWARPQQKHATEPSENRAVLSVNPCRHKSFLCPSFRVAIQV